MCFVKAINSQSDLSPLIAEEDIRVRKHVVKTNVGYTSIIKGFLYEPNKLYKGNHTIGYSISNNTMRVEEAYHSWSMDCHFADKVNDVIKKRRGQGLCEGHVFIECIIPKGSLYYEENGHIISNSIIIPPL